MNCNHTFKHVDMSDALKAYAEEKFEHVDKPHFKDCHWHVFYSQGRYDYQCEVVVTSPMGTFKAKATSEESFYVAVDEAAYKLGRQFMKLKDKVKHHKNYDRSREGRIQRVNERLEYDNSPYPHLKKPA